ncbi:MAG: hypothetical protein OJF49_001036 [Ktedonobacterales bacterium]|jgi:transcriptional regulator with XRE-family HTH domain/tetratricopeptide (TPR) repeat protein|nr:MAG: hypothetical protein OJF49_001036 [Ktedonobacterales bacterium]
MLEGQSLTFGTLLKRFRRASGLTQEELAERAELSVEAISALERGVSRAPHKDTVALLADALGLVERDRALFTAAARHRDTAPLTAYAPSDDVPPPLVGRDADLTLLDRHLAGKGPPVLLFAGEPGIGKSRLLREAAARGAASGWQTLRGGNAQRGGQEPYACVLEALQRYISGQPPARLRGDLRQCGWLARLLPELTGDGLLLPPPMGLAPEQERRLMFSAVSRFLTAIAGPAGTLLLLDDLQWADADALELALALLQSPAATPLRIIGAYRDTELVPRSPLAVALADLVRAGLVAQSQLGPLSPADSELLLARLLPDADATPATLRTEVASRAGGVPFFLVSCADGLREGTLPAATGKDVPWNVTETVRQRIAALPESARDLLAAAAVAGQPLTRTTLLTVARRLDGDERDMLLALDVACRTRLLMETGDDAYQFVHNLVRDVVWNDLGAASRAALHRQLAEALEHDEPATPAETLAYHFTHCGEREKAVIYLERAGDRAQAMYANKVAEDYYRQLVTRLDELGRATDAARAREKLGAVLRLSARYDEAMTILDAAVQVYRRTGNREGLWQATAQQGRIHARRGTASDGVARIQTLLRGADAAEPSPGLAALYIALADLSYVSGQYREQLSAAERAMAVADALGDERLHTQAEQWRSTALLTLGRTAEAIPALEEVIPQAEELGDLSSHLHALHHVALAYIRRGEFERGRAYIDRSLAVAQQLNDTVQIAHMTYYQGVLGMYTGRWKQARADFEQSLAMMRQVETAWASSYPLLGLGHLSLLEGKWEAATQSLGEAIAVAERSGDLQALQNALTSLVERDLLSEHPEVADARLARLFAKQSSRAGESAAHPVALLAWVRLELGDVMQARVLATQSLTRAVAEQNQLAQVEALRVSALIALRERQMVEAARSLDEALLLCRAMPWPYGEARVLYVYGMLAAQQGIPENAHTHLDAAAALLTALGERLYLEQVERTLSALAKV